MTLPEREWLFDDYFDSSYKHGNIFTPSSWNGLRNILNGITEGSCLRTKTPLFWILAAAREVFFII